MLDAVRRVGDDARDDDLARRELDVLPNVILVLVARVRGLQGERSCLDLEDDGRDLAQRRVRRVGPVPAPPAHVVADPVFRQARERVVQRLDPHRREPTVHLGRRRGIHRVVLGHHPRVVDLEDETRVDDHLVLGLHRVGDGVEELLLRLVEVVGALQLDRPGRDGRDERFLEVLTGQRRLEVSDVGLDRRLPAIGDGSGAHRVDHL